ncbi:metallophosphoesterase [Pseudorhizobium flavum]|uniref:metallophosphoesterase n=1 Tax=Pseudorhizobium flavum TaxID=1335061 RepID=UPI00376FF2C5
MTTFLTADTHFGHGTMLTAQKRPFASVEEMNEALIANWNAVVHPKDTVWHLGDFAMKMQADQIADVFRRLNGRKHLILGNHDYYKDGTVLPALTRLPWESISAAAQITHDGQRIMLSHYAHWAWNQSHRGSYQAYGHNHGSLPGLPGSVDVGVDCQGLKPISVEEFIRQAEETVINAEKRVDLLVEILANRLGHYREMAVAIRKRRESN